MADLQKTLGTVIRQERRRRRRSMKWLAEKSALSLVYLGEIERGKKYPSAPVLERLAWALDLPLPSLLESVAHALRAEVQPTLTVAVGRLQQVSAPTMPLPAPGTITAIMNRAA